MAVGHRAVAEDELNEASIYELYSELGDNDTPQLFDQSFRVDTDHDISTGGGNSVDRKTVYIDRTLYQEVMDGEFKATGLEPQQIVNLWLQHEHVEICLSQGDNTVDTYEPCHQRALRREHEGLLIILGRDKAAAKVDKYEETIWPGLLRAYHRPIKKPPLDLWCGPLLDDPGPRDEEILEQLRRLRVFDASKNSKEDVRYGMGEHRCKACAMWKPDKISQENGIIAWCDAVSGLVRRSRQCDLWVPKNPDNG